MNSKVLVRIIRNFGLLETADMFRFYLEVVKNQKRNKDFLKLNPEFKTPPFYLAYDAYGTVNFEAYYNSGLKAAQSIWSITNTYLTEKNLKIYEWGCGPGRIIRHLPSIDSSRIFEVTGSDYNPKTVQWLKDNLKNINFTLNNLTPPLPFESNTFDLVYCVSVFTHLSEAMYFAWLEELVRITRPKGLILITVHGDNCSNRLFGGEIADYNSGTKLIVRDKVTEGSRTYLSYASPTWMRNTFLSHLEILDHISVFNSIADYQDVWLIRKP